MVYVARRTGPVEDMLARYRLTGSGWRRLPDAGYSGAGLYSAVGTTGESWVLKRTSPGEDWIMRATADRHGREYRLARSSLLGSGPVRTAAVDGASERGYFYTLMRDVTPALVGDRRIDRYEVERIVRRVVDLHAHAVPAELDDVWCGLEYRLLLLSRGIGRVDPASVPHDLVDVVNAGWARFERYAPRPVVDLLRTVRADFSVLDRALRRLPWCLLHGDLKLDNIGLDRDGVLWLIDWALSTRGPACVELGWFVAANADRLPGTPQNVVEAYSDAVGLSGADRERHETLTALCGLLLRGWRKALDTGSAGGAREFGWWCERAGAAGRYLS
jgi:hypothetical protein